MFIPTLHIFIGKDNHFFTLRESYLHERWFNTSSGPKCEREVRYMHLFNLSQDYAEAYAKAVEASKNFGLKLVASDNREEQLLEIKRRTAEEVEQDRIRQEAINAELQAKYEEARREEWRRWKIEAKFYLECLYDDTPMTLDILLVLLENGKIDKENYLDAKAHFELNPSFAKSKTYTEPRMIGGHYHGKYLNSIPLSYLQWLVHTSGLVDIDAEATMHKMAYVAKWISENMEIPLPTPVKSEWVGEVGEKVELEVTIDRVIIPNGYSSFSWGYLMTDSEGRKINWWASREQDWDGSKTLKIKGTIKALNEYKDVKQTVLTRVKEIA